MGNLVSNMVANAIASGVPANTIVLLLLLPLVTSVIAAARHLIGIRGFGIFLPAALAVAFVATGPLLGIALFLVIVALSTLARLTLRKLKIKLQYLPRMAFILWLVVIGVLGVLFTAPIFPNLNIANVSIFAILILVLLAEEFTRVQLGKSIRTAIDLTGETLFLAFISYLFLTNRPLQDFALVKPEILLGGVVIFDLILGRYAGLRLIELWRFRNLIKN